MNVIRMPKNKSLENLTSKSLIELAYPFSLSFSNCGDSEDCKRIITPTMPKNPPIQKARRQPQVVSDSEEKTLVINVATDAARKIPKKLAPMTREPAKPRRWFPACSIR